MDSSIFHPKGPLSLFLTDLENDTIGWREADKFRYLRVLDHMFHQGGFIPDADDYLADIMDLRKGRGWRNTVALIRSKLIILDLAEPETKAFANDLLTALQTVSYSICLTQKRVLRDVKKAKEHAAKSAKGGHAKAEKYSAPGSAQAVPPYLSKKESKKEGAGAPRQYAFEGEVIRLKSANLETWRSRFKNVPNLEAELTSYDAYLSDQPEEERKRWFHRTPAWLARKDAEYAAKATAGERVAAI